MLWNLRQIIPMASPSSTARSAAFKFAASHIPCTSCRKHSGLSYWRFFTRGVILKLGNGANNCSWVLTHVGAAQFAW